jgi:hypothetical protein
MSGSDGGFFDFKKVGVHFIRLFTDITHSIMRSLERRQCRHRTEDGDNDAFSDGGRWLKVIMQCCGVHKIVVH